MRSRLPSLVLNFAEVGKATTDPDKKAMQVHLGLLMLQLLLMLLLLLLLLLLILHLMYLLHLLPQDCLFSQLKTSVKQVVETIKSGEQEKVVER